MLVDQTKAVQYLLEIKDSFVAAFRTSSLPPSLPLLRVSLLWLTRVGRVGH
jgi:hypothetical protein